MSRWTHGLYCFLLVGGLTLSGRSALASDSAGVLGTVQGMGLSARVYADGSYAIATAGAPRPVIRSSVQAAVDGAVLSSGDYPRHEVQQAEVSDSLGVGSTLTVIHTGLAGRPDLVCILRLMHDQPWGEITVEVRNATGHSISVKSIRSVHADSSPVLELGAAAVADRILSDSFSEDRPQLAIRDLGAAPRGLHRAVGSQLIYNRNSHESLFFGALTSERLLTILRTQVELYRTLQRAERLQAENQLLRASGMPQLT